MKNNSLDNIVECEISLSSPVAYESNTENILVIAEPPSGGSGKMEKTIRVESPEDLEDAGYTDKESAYIAATVIFDQTPAPEYVYFCARKKSEESYEDLSVTLDRVNGEANFYGLALCGFEDKADILAAAKWAEENEKLFGYTYSGIDAIPLEDKTYYRTFGVFAGNIDEEGDQVKRNSFAALGLMAKCFRYDPGSETWHLKEIADISPSSLSREERSSLEEANINMYLRYAGSNVTDGGKVLAGEWIDVIRFRDWLKDSMQKQVFQTMKSNRKVPFSDGGIGLIEGAMEKTLLEGQTVGGIYPSEYDEDGNETPGFTVKVPRAGDFTEAQRKGRKATGFKYSARLAGAIHAVTIKGNLVF